MHDFSYNIIYNWNINSIYFGDILGDVWLYKCYDSNNFEVNAYKYFKYDNIFNPIWFYINKYSTYNEFIYINNKNLYFPIVVSWNGYLPAGVYYIKPSWYFNLISLWRYPGRHVILPAEYENIFFLNINMFYFVDDISNFEAIWSMKNKYFKNNGKWFNHDWDIMSIFTSYTDACHGCGWFPWWKQQIWHLKRIKDYNGYKLHNFLHYCNSDWLLYILPKSYGLYILYDYAGLRSTTTFITHFIYFYYSKDPFFKYNFFFIEDKFWDKFMLNNILYQILWIILYNIIIYIYIYIIYIYVNYYINLYYSSDISIFYENMLFYSKFYYDKFLQTYTTFTIYWFYIIWPYISYNASIVFFYLLNYMPLPLFYEKNLWECVSEGVDMFDAIHAEKQVIKPTKKDKILTFLLSILEYYLEHIAYLFYTISFRIIYTISISLNKLLYYFLIKLFYRNTYIFGTYHIILYCYFYVKLNINKNINLNININLYLWVILNNIKIILFNFFHQCLLVTNVYFTYILKFIYFKNFKFLNQNIIESLDYIPISKFITTKFKYILPFIQNYKLYCINFNKYIFKFLIKYIYYFLIFIFNFLYYLFVKVNYKLHYFYLLIKFKIYDNFNNNILSFLCLLIIIYFLKKYIIVLFIFFSYNYLNNFVINKYINNYINNIKYILYYTFDIIFWIIGFIFYTIFNIFSKIIFFMFKIIFLFIWKIKIFILIFLFFNIYMDLDTMGFFLYVPFKFISVCVLKTFYPIYMNIYDVIIDWSLITNVDDWSKTSYKFIDYSYEWIYFEWSNLKYKFSILVRNWKEMRWSDIIYVRGPLSFYLYIRETKLHKMIYVLFMCFFKTFLIWLFFKITPLLFLKNNNYFFYWYLWFIYRILLLLLKYTKYHFMHLYFYMIPYYANIYYVNKIFLLYNIYFGLKYNIFIVYFIWKDIFYLDKIFFFIYNLIYFIFAINIYFMSKIYIFILYCLKKKIMYMYLKSLNIFLIDFYWSLDSFINKYFFLEENEGIKFMYIQFYYIRRTRNFYIFINYWNEWQTYVDEFYSNLRFSRYKLKRWLYKKKIDKIFLHFDRALEVIPSIFAKESEDAINKGVSFNSILKGNTTIVGGKSVFTWIDYYKDDNRKIWPSHNKDNFKDMFLDFHFKSDKKLSLRNFFHYYLIGYFLIYIIFRFFFNLYNNNKYYFYNSEYLWTLTRLSFNKKFLTKKKFLNELITYTKNKVNLDDDENKKFHYFRINRAYKFNSYLIKFLKFKINIIKDFFKLKFYNIWINKLKKKRKNWKNLYKFFQVFKIYKNIKHLIKFKKYFTGLKKLNEKKINNIYFDFIYLDSYKNFYAIYTKYYNYMFFFMAYIYRKNKYVPYIFKQELSAVEESIMVSDDYIIHKNLMYKVLNYFYWIDKNLLNKNSPDWLLHKNKTTIFINVNKSNIENFVISLTLPFELDFFFICVVPQMILSSYYHSVLAYNYWAEIIREVGTAYFFILNNINIDYIWNLVINFFNPYEGLATAHNINSIHGGKAFDWIRILTKYKFRRIDPFFKYKNLYDLDKNFYFYNDNIISSAFLKKIYFFKNKFFLFFIFFIFFGNNLIINLFNNYFKFLDFNKIMSINYYYKLKIFIWNIYLKKKVYKKN